MSKQSWWIVANYCRPYFSAYHYYKIFGCLLISTIMFMISVFQIDARAQTRFLSGFADIPVPDQAYEVQESGIIYDTPEYVFATWRLLSGLPISKIYTYYDEALKNLGWVGQKGRYQRDGIQLHISSEGSFDLTERGQSAHVIFMQIETGDTSRARPK